jgi:hypothetical protein
MIREWRLEMWLLRERSLLGLKEDKHIRLQDLEHDGLMISVNLRRDGTILL